MVNGDLLRLDGEATGFQRLVPGTKALLASVPRKSKADGIYA